MNLSLKQKLSRISIISLGLLVAVALALIPPRSDRAIRSYHNEYNGIVPGITTRAEILTRFGQEQNAQKNLNNTRFEYQDFAYTINDGEDRVNSILISTVAYVSPDGFSVGTPYTEVLAKITPNSPNQNNNNVSNRQNGITYWFKDGHVSLIVLAAEMSITRDR